MSIMRNANTVTVDEIDDALVIGFAWLNGDGRPEEYVMLQRSLNPVEDEPGINGVYVERDDQRFSGSGGIVRFVLHRDHALMELDDQLAAALGAPDLCREVTLGFSINDAALAQLRGGLARLFTGCGCFADQTQWP